MAPENEQSSQLRRSQLAEAMVQTKRRQIALNRACAHKSAQMGEKPTPEEMAALRAAINDSHAAHEALIDHLQSRPTAA
jgi:hypothetical protein